MKPLHLKRPITGSVLLLVFLFVKGLQSVSAETPSNPPGSYYTSWLGNTFMDLTGSRNVTGELEDMCLSASGHIFTAGYADTHGGGASYNATDGSFMGRYGNFGSNFGDLAKSVAADNIFVYWGIPEGGLLRAPHGGSAIYDHFPSGNISGLFVKNGKLYVSDFSNGRIRVLNTSDMSEVQSWACDKPSKLTVDNNGNVWVVIRNNLVTDFSDEGPVWWGEKIRSFSPAGIPGPEITDFEKPIAIAVDNSNHLLVGGLNSHSQIWKYDISGTPFKTGTFGENSGIFNNIAGEFTTAAKLHWIKSIAVDASGNIYTACIYGTFWGDCIEKWNTSGQLVWRDFAGSATDCAGIDPTNETEVYSKYHHYSIDYSKTVPGTEWKLKGFTVNRFKYPNDYRVDPERDKTERSLGAGAFRIGGKLFIARSSQLGNMWELYRQETTTEGEVLVPSVVMGSGIDLKNRFYNLNTKSWIDQPKKDSLYNQYWNLAKNGDIFSIAVLESPMKIIHYKYGGLDANSNPVWDTSNATLENAPELSSIGRLFYDSDEDVMYLAGDHPESEFGTFAKIKRFNNWSKGNRTSSYTAFLPINDPDYTPELSFSSGLPIAFTVAGDYIFINYVYGHVRILKKSDGSLVGTLVQNVANGWKGGLGQVDGAFGLTVTKRTNGEYVCLFENAAWANIMMIRWCITSTCPYGNVAVTDVSVSPALASINVGATQQLTVAVAPSNATNKAVTWSSSNTAVATVSSGGLVTGVTAGTATITVKTTDGSKTATSAVTVNAVTGCTASGTILYQRWNGISGTAVSDLTSNTNYPNTPTSSSSLTSMEAGTNVADNCVARIAGYICAPATGAYTFWIASDDASQLWLSTDGTAANKVKIAEVTTWTNSREWGKQTSQKSATINLTQGQSYYVEALMKEGSGGDNLAVGWLKPGQTGTAPSEVVPGSVLSPLLVELVPVTGVSVIPTAPSIVVGNTQQLTATLAPSDATNKSIYWSSSNTAVATVSSSGLVTGVTVGTATITVKTVDGGKTATCAVTVTASTISCTDEQGTVTCYKAASTITVDGNLNEASWCISNTITKTDFGTKNNAVTFGILYDNTNIYIGVKVLDANVFAANNTFPWENDGIELYFDPNNSGGTSYDSNDRQYIKAASSLALWANAGGTTGASVNWATISGGYTMEFKIPFSLLGISSTPANNTLLGFDIGNDDDDNGSGRSTQISWNDATGNDYSNPSLFGKLKISSIVKGGEISASTTIASGISVYPNPSDGTSLTLQGLSDKTMVNIYSLTGSLVYNTRVHANGDVKLEGLNLKQGVYTLSIISEGNSIQTFKLIVN